MTNLLPIAPHELGDFAAGIFVNNVFLWREVLIHRAALMSATDTDAVEARWDRLAYAQQRDLMTDAVLKACATLPTELRARFHDVAETIADSLLGAEVIFER
jgi:hypothetical protein